MPGANSGKMNRGKASSMAAKNSFRPTQASKKQPVIRSEKEIQEIRTKAKKKSERAEQELVQLKLSGFEDAIKRSLHLLEIVQVNRGDSKKEREFPIKLKCLQCDHEFEGNENEKPTDQLTNHIVFGHGTDEEKEVYRNITIPSIRLSKLIEKCVAEFAKHAVVRIKFTGERTKALRVPVDCPAFEYLDLFGCELRFDGVQQSNQYWFKFGPLDRNGEDVDVFIDFSPYIKKQNNRSEEQVMKRLIAWNYGEKEFVKSEYSALEEMEKQKIAETLKIRESFDELWAVLETNKVNGDYQLIKKELKESKQTDKKAPQTTSTE
ncbi:unnamed protein product [Caenorhabditis nigoni]